MTDIPDKVMITISYKDTKFDIELKPQFVTDMNFLYNLDSIKEHIFGVYEGLKEVHEAVIKDYPSKTLTTETKTEHEKRVEGIIGQMTKGDYETFS